MASNFGRFYLTPLKHQLLGLTFVWLVFLLPTNLFLSFNQDSAYVTGMFSDYLVLKLYLSEIFLWLFTLGILIFARKQFVAWLTKTMVPVIQRIPHKKILLIILIALLLRQVGSQSPITGVWNFIQWMEAGWLIITTSFFYSLNPARFFKLLMLGLVGTIIFQSAVGSYQFYWQKSLVGYFLLGEPDLSVAINLSRQTLSLGREIVLPYGTTAHPNLLGGYLAVYATLILGLLNLVRSNVQKKLLLIPVTIACLSLLATHSITAMFTAIIGIGFALGLNSTKIINRLLQTHCQKYWAIGLVTLLAIGLPLLLSLTNFWFPDSSSIDRRVWLHQASFNMTLRHPVFGVGIGQFVTQLTKFTENPDVWRFLQPVHTSIWLFLSETGLLGVLLIYLLWQGLNPAQKNSVLITSTLLIAPLGLDHYLGSLQPGRWLWAVVFVGVYLLLKKPTKS